MTGETSLGSKMVVVGSEVGCSIGKKGCNGGALMSGPSETFGVLQGTRGFWVGRTEDSFGNLGILGVEAVVSLGKIRGS